MALAIAKQALQPSFSALHIGKFYPPYMGGMETHLQALCESLQSEVNVEVVVANQHRQSVEDRVRGVKVTRAGALFNVSSAPICPQMLSAIRRSQADIVHLHLPNPMAVLALLASGRRGKVIATYHSDIVRQKMQGRLFEPILRRALDRCDAIIVTSPNYMETSPILPSYREKCRVIPLGINYDQYQTHDELAAARLRRRYGQRIILSVGRLVYYKGFEYLIRAMRTTDGHLLIVGQGPLRAELEQLARECGVVDRVTFLGHLSDTELLHHYYAASVFALASIARSEAFGLVQLEAMACGKPVVNTQLASGVPYVSLNRVTGLTALPKDPNTLSVALNRLLDNPELRARYGAAARERVRKEFTIEVMTRRTIQLYNQVLSQSQSAVDYRRMLNASA
jgi:glycosyltransferase involved in cell wall biosynthesis